MPEFYLRVQQIENTCWFELRSGNGPQYTAHIPYLPRLTSLYQDWRYYYLRFYNSALRARVENSGSIAPHGNWRTSLVQAEAQLLTEFQDWLRHPELATIRDTIAQAALADSPSPFVDIFLTCEPLDLARLPWEAWSIVGGIAVPKRIRIARTSSNIMVGNGPRHHRARLRILAVLGDETGLDFDEDKKALQSLSRIADVQFTGWQPNKEIQAVRKAILEALTDPQGWDILFFSGHSNETESTGGELAIARGESLHINEILPSLTEAKNNGLQVAIFNSCSGLSIADSLIRLGLSQVVVMREPIHNQVAQALMVPFLQGLAQGQDLHQALLTACDDLKLKKSLDYPSANLIPSLFRHPEVPLFRYQSWGIFQFLTLLTPWLPNPRQAIALLILLTLSSSLPLQNWLLERRMLVQALYSQGMGQGKPTALPPVCLVEIDERSIQKAGIANPRPMDRSYLAKLVSRLAELDTPVLGIDYVLDRSHPDGSDRQLAQALQAAIARKPKAPWLVLAIDRDDNTNQWLEPLPEIASPAWSLQGHILLNPAYVPFDRTAGNIERPPLASMLALASQVRGKLSSRGLQPQLSNQADFSQQIEVALQSQTPQGHPPLSSRIHAQPITMQAFAWGQMWLNPVIDYSIPPSQVYSTTPAWQLLDNSPPVPLGCQFSRQVVILIPFYAEAGIKFAGEDAFPLPLATQYWLKQDNPNSLRNSLAGGEIHAYLVHHWLRNRLVVPIPDLWMVGGMVLLARITTLVGQGQGQGQRQRQRQKQASLKQSFQKRPWLLLALLPATGVYGLVSLQVYMVGAILLPWCLPMVALGSYIALE